MATADVARRLTWLLRLEFIEEQRALAVAARPVT
jgi:hypothetical protein